MKLKNREIVLYSRHGDVRIRRDRHGIPEIRGDDYGALAFGLGFVHANDRQLQTLLTRVLLQGRAAELLAADDALVEVDRFMRRMNFLPDPEVQAGKLEPAARDQLEAYADGFNRYLEENGPVWEFRLLGYKPEPWTIRDSLVLGKVFGYIGLADAQGAMEKLLTQMIQNDMPEKKLRELFPYLTEKIDYKLLKSVKLAPPLVPEALAWLKKIPAFRASNNWTVAGRLSASGKPIYCSDPHLEVNRLPSVWMEVVMKTPDNTLIGASIPGAPGLGIGRSSHIAWGATYSFMDMIDYRVEHCRDGRYRRGNGWKPFTLREEVIKRKKKDPVVEKVYENELGLLEGDPGEESHRLLMCWSGARDCGAGEFNALLNVWSAKTVKEAMGHFKKMDAATFNWVLADTAGNIGYQMSGRLYNRPGGVSGLVPLPAWEAKYNPRGFVRKEDLPSSYNPGEGYIVTANQDLNHLGKANPINLPMAPYRALRIEQLLKKNTKLDPGAMKKIHFDLYSLQAERLMKLIAPLLPDTDNGSILKEWEYTYTPDSRGATLFESVYLALLKTVFGDHGMGRDVVEHVMKETGIFNDYYGNFDTILQKTSSPWFEGKKRDELFRLAINEGLAVTARPYGSTRKVMISHLLFGGKFPRFLGFDYGPVELPGCRATVPQGQIFTSAGRTTTFSPSYRMIADMATGEAHTNIAGGPSDRRFSKWYVSDFQNWLMGVYKVLS